MKMSFLNKENKSLVSAWFFLVLAIISEVIGTSFLASAVRSSNYINYIIMSIALAFSYFFLALSTKIISIGAAYAIWEGLGLIMLTTVGILIFNESISLIELLGLTAAITGIICVTLGENH